MTKLCIASRFVPDRKKGGEKGLYTISQRRTHRLYDLNAGTEDSIVPDRVNARGREGGKGGGFNGRGHTRQQRQAYCIGAGLQARSLGTMRMKEMLHLVMAEAPEPSEMLDAFILMGGGGGGGLIVQWQNTHT